MNMRSTDYISKGTVVARLYKARESQDVGKVIGFGIGYGLILRI